MLKVGITECGDAGLGEKITSCKYYHHQKSK